MARVTTKNQIGNLALGYCKVDAVTSIDPPDRGNLGAQLCYRHYDEARREVLSEADWDCAKKRFQAPAASPAPLFGWENKFLLPADYIRLSTVNDEKLPETDYTIEDGYLLCNLPAPLNLVYIFDQEAIAKFSPKLIQCVALKMAIYMAYPLTGNRTMVTELKDSYKDMLGDGRTLDAQQNPPKKVQRSKWAIAKEAGIAPRRWWE